MQLYRRSKGYSVLGKWAIRGFWILVTTLPFINWTLAKIAYLK